MKIEKKNIRVILAAVCATVVLTLAMFTTISVHAYAQTESPTITLTALSQISDGYDDAASGVSCIIPLD